MIVTREIHRVPHPAQHALRDAGIPLDEIARRAGKSRATISRQLAGIVKVSAIVKVIVCELLGREERNLFFDDPADIEREAQAAYFESLLPPVDPPAEGVAFWETRPAASVECERGITADTGRIDTETLPVLQVIVERTDGTRGRILIHRDQAARLVEHMLAEMESAPDWWLKL